MTMTVTDTDERPSLSRRSLIRGAALAVGGVTAAALIGCGEDDEATVDDAAGGSPAASTATAAAPVEGVTVAGRLIPYNFPEPPGKTPKPGGTAQVAVTWDVSTMDPSKSAAGGTVTVPNIVYDRMLGFRRGPQASATKVEIVPEIAKSWETSPDGLTYTFKLEPNVKWQNIAPLNGRAFKAADVKFAYERYAKEGVHKSYLSNVKAIETPDDTTIRFALSRPQPDFIVPLASRYLTIHPKELVDSGEIDKRVIGTGPMILKDAAAGVGASFQRNPDHWRGAPLLEGFNCKYVLDPASQLASFRAKQFDWGSLVGGSPLDLEALLKTNPDIQANATRPVGATFSMQFNLSNPRYQDERIRRAVSLAMDRQEITNVVHGGLGFALPVMPWVFVFDEPPTPESGLMGKWFRTDIAEAKRLLQAAGTENLEVPMISYNYGDSSNRKPNEVLVDQMRRAGIKLDVRNIDYTEFNSQWVGAKFTEVADGWATQGHDADNFFYAQVHSTSAGNRGRINDAQLDQWSDAERSEINPQARRELLRKIWDRYLDQAYRVDKPVAQSFSTYQPWLRGLRWVGSLGVNSSFYDWGPQIKDVWIDK